MKQIHGVLLPPGFMTVVSSHVRKAVRVVVVQWLSEWDVVSWDGLGVGGFHGGGLTLKNELGIHVGHEMPGGEEHGDVAARVHDYVLFASGEPPAFEQRQHLAARLGDADVEQDAVDVLHCGSTQNGCLDQKVAMRVQC